MSRAETVDPGAAPARRRNWALGIAVLLLLVAVVRGRPILHPDVCNIDEAHWVTLAASIRAGLTPYLDVYDIKPPGLLYLYAACDALTPWSFVAIRAVQTLCYLGTAALLLAVGGQLGRPEVGLASVVLFAVGSMAGPPTEMLAAESEGFFILFTTATFVCALQCLRVPALGWAALVGLAGCAGGLFKQPALVEGVGIMVGLAAASAVEGRLLRGLLRVVVAGLAAGAAAAVVIGLFAGMGAAEALYFWVVQYGREVYSQSGGRTWLLAVDIAWLFPPLYLGGAFATCAALWRFTLPGRDRDRSLDPVWLLLLSWLGAACLGAALAGRAFPHYFLAVMPPLSLATALGLSSLLRPLSAQRQAIVWVLVMLLCLPWGLYWATRPLPREGITRVLGEMIRQVTEPAETIMVWGYEPRLYFHAQRRSASGDPVAVFLSGWDIHAGLEDFERRRVGWIRPRELARLTAAPPTLLVDFSEVGYVPLATFPELYAWREREYVLLDRIPPGSLFGTTADGLVGLYVRRDRFAAVRQALAELTAGRQRGGR